MRIAIIVGSTRPGRKGSTVGRWVHDHALQRDDVPGKVDFDLLELEDFDLPLLDEPTIPAAAGGEYEVPQTRAWSERIVQYDGFVFVTPEYNHGVPAAMKNAVDVLGPEWADKAVGFVSYGADGGVRAVEHWRNVAANLLMSDVRAQVSLLVFEDWKDGEFRPLDRREQELDTMLGQLVEMTESVRALRVGSEA
ncbi:NAD(P)H-dependent FMN reductase [Marmoricola sp. URHA0025 HA25]